MKKLFFTLAAVLFAVSSLVSSCTKDYNVDIDKILSRLDALEQQINGGAVITAVDNVANGVKVTLSNGKSFTLTNGTSADVWTIGTDGYWYKNGVKQSYLATGTNGDTYVPKEDGYFYINGTQKTDIMWKGASGDMAVVYNPETGTLTVTGAEGMEEGETVTLGSSVLSGLILDPTLLTPSGKPLYLPQVGMVVGNTGPLPQPELHPGIFEVVCELNPSNANVDSYGWQIIAEATPVFQLYGVKTEELFTVVDVIDGLDGTVILLCSINPDLDFEYLQEELAEFVQNVNNPNSLELFVKATSESGVTVTSNKGQFYPVPVEFDEAVLLYDYANINSQIPTPTPFYQPDSLHLVSAFAIDMYCDRSLTLTPVLVDGNMTYFEDNASGFYDFPENFAYYANADYVFAPDYYIDNYYPDEILTLDFPVEFEYALEDEAGYFSDGNEFVDTEVLPYGILQFIGNEARFTTVKIAVTPVIDGVVMSNLADTLVVYVGDNAPQEYTTDPIDLGDVDYLLIDTATVGATPAQAIANALNAAIEETGFVDFEYGGYAIYEGNYGKDIDPAPYSQFDDTDSTFALTKAVPFGEGEATIVFGNPNGDEIAIPIIWNVVVTTPAFELYEDVVTLSAHKAADPSVVAGTATQTYYDITPYNLFENVNIADPAVLEDVILTTLLCDPLVALEQVDIDYVTPGEEENIFIIADLVDESYETDVLVEAVCDSQAWDETLGDWIPAALTEEVFTVVFVNDLEAEVGSPIAVTTVGNVETDSICLVDFITVSNANEIIFQGSAVSGTDAEVINDLFIVDNSFLSFEIDPSTLPPTVVANNYLTWDENGVVIWNEVAAQDGSYTQTTDVDVTFTVTVKLGSTEDQQLVTTATGTFTLKKKFN
ncbi:MAG: hypothetical protein J6Z27_03335 [Bacteroidales bacterium]|nr:hypothetical protein [Bacteroidales bacterium]